VNSEPDWVMGLCNNISLMKGYVTYINMSDRLVGMSDRLVGMSDRSRLVGMSDRSRLVGMSDRSGLVGPKRMLIMIA